MTRAHPILVAFGLLVFVAPLGARAEPSGVPRSFELVSVSTGGAQGDNDSFSPSISDDGRYVTFVSRASNLTAVNTGFVENVYLRDTVLGTTRLVSVAHDGGAANGPVETQRPPQISLDGRYVVFSSSASNLVASDSNELWDVFLRDLASNTTTRVSQAEDGTEGNGGSGLGGLSYTGRYVVFSSWASNLVPNDMNGLLDVFVYDSMQQTLSILPPGGTTNPRWPGSAVDGVSGDGRYLVITEVETNYETGLYRYDRLTGAKDAITTPFAGGFPDGNSYGYGLPTISVDGRHVAFLSYATNLVPNDTNAMIDIFHWDGLSRQLERVSVSDAGDQTVGWTLYNHLPSMAPNGRFVGFTSAAANLVPADANGTVADIFIRDLGAWSLELFPINSSGEQGNGISGSVVFDLAGDTIAFDSHATNLVPGDGNGKVDVFLTSSRVLLDLPIAYDEQTYAPGDAFARCVTAVFDHQYPGQTGLNGDQWLLSYTGLAVPDPTGPECTYGVNCYDGHEGYDFDDLFGCGSVALAAAPGTIDDMKSGCGKEYGCQVVVAHENGYETLYGHLRDDDFLRTEGGVVRGEVLGAIGATGAGALGTHLHFGVYHDGQVVDPSGWLGSAQDPWAVLSGEDSHALWRRPLKSDAFLQAGIGVAQTISGTSRATFTLPIASASGAGGAQSDDLFVSMIEVPWTDPNGALLRIGPTVQVTATDSTGAPVTGFVASVELEMDLYVALLPQVMSETIAVYEVSEDGSLTALPSNVDSASGVVSSEITQAGNYALLAVPSHVVYLPLVSR